MILDTEDVCRNIAMKTGKKLSDIIEIVQSFELELIYQTIDKSNNVRINNGNARLIVTNRGDKICKIMIHKKRVTISSMLVVSPVM
jgi:uncharacterized protein YvpB